VEPIGLWSNRPPRPNDGLHGSARTCRRERPDGSSTAGSPTPRRKLRLGPRTAGRRAARGHARNRCGHDAGEERCAGDHRLMRR
jgi:hypothetical protein